MREERANRIGGILGVVLESLLRVPVVAKRAKTEND